jgi:hypothetical protein
LASGLNQSCFFSEKIRNEKDPQCQQLIMCNFYEAYTPTTPTKRRESKIINYPGRANQLKKI